MFGDSRVQEVGSDDDSDGHGVGLSARRQTRFVSDSLQFTGTDLGDRSGGLVRRGHRYQDSEDDDETEDSEESVSEDQDDTEEGSYSGGSSQSQSAREEALVQSALKRISRAQAQGRADVKLNKEELAALERRRKRMEEEAARAERERAAKASGGSGSDRKKRKEQRVAIPLSQFEPISNKKRSAHPKRKDSLPLSRRQSVGGDSPDGQVYPPMGYFPPPSQSRSRSSSHMPRPNTRSRENNGSSPPVAFHQHSSHHAPSHRHASDSMTRPHSRGLPHEEWMQNPSAVDPFQYQTDGPRLAYPTNVPVSSSKSRSEVSYKQPRGHGTSSRHGSARPSLSRVADSETSEEDTASDELGNGAQIREPARGRNREIVVEVSPEPEPAPVKKKSSSPTKRKPAPNGRKKKK